MICSCIYCFSKKSLNIKKYIKFLNFQYKKHKDTMDDFLWRSVEDLVEKRRTRRTKLQNYKLNAANRIKRTINQ